MILKNWDIDFTDFRWKTFDCETYADTFIEWCFEQKCYSLRQGKRLLNEWRTRKEKYISRLDTIVFDFQHFSRHDSSHSVNILNSIELVLGRNRVKMLSCSDLWLLLESAYFHDIGMALTDAERREILSDDEFKKFVNSVLIGNSIDEREASNYLKQAENRLNGKSQTDGIEGNEGVEFTDCWPADVSKNASILIASYIRKTHPQRSKKFMNSLLVCEDTQKNDSEIKERLNRLVALVSELHGKNFKDIYTVVHHDLGFDTEYLHPQFAAAMLRLGDLLDLDNNRFNIRAIEHFGDIPILSSYHYEKHKAIYHFSIDEEKIEVSAYSDKDNVCREVGKWFNWLKKEVEDLICDWNIIVPDYLKGCTLQRCKLEIKFGDTEYDSESYDSFSVDRENIISLMTGSNIYESKADCFREYIQNAFDASKMQLWLDIKNKKTSILDDNKKLSEITPFDISGADYEDLAVEVNISSYNEDNKLDICIKIIDHGIGMESECISNISVVGRGWKTRKIYMDAVQEMPDWLKPTGGFGIGLQSAFMLTDHVEITTKSIFEASCHTIEFDSPQKGGSIIKKISKQYAAGTTVKIHIPNETFIHIANNSGKLNEGKENAFLPDPAQSECDVFSDDYIEIFAFNFFRSYLEANIPNPLFPIKIVCSQKEYTYRSVYASEGGGFKPIKGLCEKGDYIYDVSDKFAVRIWDKKEKTFVCILPQPNRTMNFSNEIGRLSNHFCYRNFKVNNINEQKLGIRYFNFICMCIDIMNQKTSDVLSLRRNDFISDFKISEYYKKYLSLYVDIITNNDKNIDNIGKYLNVYLFILMAIQMTDKEKASKAMTAFIEKVENRIQTIGYLKNNRIAKKEESTKSVLQKIFEIYNDPEIDKFNGKIIFVAKEQNTPANETLRISLAKENTADDGGIVSMLKNGAWIYTDSELCNALHCVGKKFRTKNFTFYEDNEELVYTMISGLDENWEFEKSFELKEEELYKRVFGNSGIRYIAENADCGPYNDLKVTCLPNASEPDSYQVRRKTYIISPIGEKALRKIDFEIKSHGISHISDKFADWAISEDDFIKLITEEKDFDFLTHWVYHNQVVISENEKTIDHIKKMYLAMLRNIYKYYKSRRNKQ